MAAEPVASWDLRGLFVKEATFGTTPNPASAQALELVSFSTGMAGELGNTRAKEDRGVGRGITTGYVSGHIVPMDFSATVNLKTRSAVDATPDVDPIYAAAGLRKATTGGVSVAYTTTATPVEDAHFAGLSAYRLFGQATYNYEAEQLRGGVVKKLTWTGGEKEAQVVAEGSCVGKYTLGYIDSITLGDGSGTTLTTTAEESYRLAIGWYQVESEIIKVTTVNYGSTSHTIARAQLSSSGVAHSAKPLSPYMPSISFTGSPLSEASVVVTIDSIATRCMSYSITFNSGIDLRPPESGSTYVQGPPKVMRYSASAAFKLVLNRELVGMLNKASQRKAVAITVVQSNASAASSIQTFSLPYCELEQFAVPDTANDVAIVDVSARCRDSAGNDMFSLTLT